jgi:hypothetical protein
MMAQALGRKWSLFNERIHDSVSAMTDKILNLQEYNRLQGNSLYITACM